MEGVPIFVRDVAEVKFGGEVRQGASIKDGYTESVTGIVMMLRGGNAKEIVGRVKEKVAEINERKLLPGGLQIVPFYDRTDTGGCRVGDGIQHVDRVHNPRSRGIVRFARVTCAPAWWYVRRLSLLRW